MTQILCTIGLHAWKGCQCERCRRQRDEGHDWDLCLCKRCNQRKQVTDESHSWDGCTCRRCGTVKDQGHIWKDCWCIHCRKPNHLWERSCLCLRCGELSPHDADHTWQEIDVKVKEEVYTPGGPSYDWDSVTVATTTTITYRCRTCERIKEESSYDTEEHTRG